MMHPNDLVALAKGGGPNAWALSLASVGLYGGQFAIQFAPSFVDAVSFACVAAVYIGFIVVSIRVIKGLFHKDPAQS